MKKVFFFLLFILVAWTSYHDLTKGTLPQPKETTAQAIATSGEPQQSEKQKKNYIIYKVKPGDTVLSVVEQLNTDITVSIQQVLKDFKRLNPKVNPHQIKIGQTYTFPIYHR